MKKQTSDEPERCPGCGANLALVGRSHNCSGSLMRGVGADAPQKKPRPCPHGMHHPHACPDCMSPPLAEDVVPDDLPFTKDGRLMQGALQSTRAKGEAEHPSHPDCARCNRNRELARERARARRGK